jgi:hypothetical protein
MKSWLFGPDEEQVTFYPTYGYQQDDHWVIPLRIWVHENRAVMESLITGLAASLGDLLSREIDNFRSRMAEFVADDESGEEVRFAFDNDPENEEYQLQEEGGGFPRSDLNGLLEGFISLSAAKADTLLKRQDSRFGWLTFRAVSRDHTGTGRVRLLSPQGRSVISDIDDTIKVTEIPAGTQIVVRNTFFRDFLAAPDMAKMYQGLGDASFHYVSGGPWQLFKPLARFLLGPTGGFPEGTFHMKNIRKNLLSLDTWRDLRELAGGDATFEQKVTQISEILEKFPARKFILVGDAGERDPEVYTHIRTRFPNQVQEIRIRDVVNDRENRPKRLKGMTILPAPTVLDGVSQFDRQEEQGTAGQASPDE